MLESYNFADYEPETLVPRVLAYNEGEEGSQYCANLIKRGIY